ncbi:unnamed protein product, partial [Prorocentrum cordatum]
RRPGGAAREPSQGARRGASPGGAACSDRCTSRSSSRVSTPATQPCRRQQPRHPRLEPVGHCPQRGAGSPGHRPCDRLRQAAVPGEPDGSPPGSEAEAAGPPGGAGVPVVNWAAPGGVVMLRPRRSPVPGRSGGRLSRLSSHPSARPGRRVAACASEGARLDASAAAKLAAASAWRGAAVPAVSSSAPPTPAGGPGARRGSCPFVGGVATGRSAGLALEAGERPEAGAAAAPVPCWGHDRDLVRPRTTSHDRHDQDRSQERSRPASACRHGPRPEGGGDERAATAPRSRDRTRVQWGTLPGVPTAFGLGAAAAPADDVMQACRLAKECMIPIAIVQQAFVLFKEHAEVPSPGDGVVELGRLAKAKFWAVLRKAVAMDTDGKGTEVDDDVVDGAFRLADNNEDGSISFREFVIWYFRVLEPPLHGELQRGRRGACAARPRQATRHHRRRDGLVQAELRLPGRRRQRGPRHGGVRGASVQVRQGAPAH